MVGNGGAVRRGDVAEIQIVALGVEEARLHYSDYELNEVPIERQGIRRSICDLFQIQTDLKSVIYVDHEAIIDHLMHMPGGPDQAVHFVERGRLADGLGLHDRLQALAVFGQVIGLVADSTASYLKADSRQAY